MTKDEKRALSVQRELAELAELSKSFDVVVADAVRLAADLRDAADRCRRTMLEDEIDQRIDRLDYLLKRGKYANLGESFPDLSNSADSVNRLSIKKRDVVVPISEAFYRDRG